MHTQPVSADRYREESPPTMRKEKRLAGGGEGKPWLNVRD